MGLCFCGQNTDGNRILCGRHNAQGLIEVCDFPKLMRLAQLPKPVKVEEPAAELTEQETLVVKLLERGIANAQARVQREAGY